MPPADQTGAISREQWDATRQEVHLSLFNLQVAHAACSKQHQHVLKVYFKHLPKSPYTKAKWQQLCEGKTDTYRSQGSAGHQLKASYVSSNHTQQDVFNKKHHLKKKYSIYNMTLDPWGRECDGRVSQSQHWKKEGRLQRPAGSEGNITAVKPNTAKLKSALSLFHTCTYTHAHTL